MLNKNNINHIGDLHDVIFSLTAEDLAAIQGKPGSVPAGKDSEVVRTYRLLLIKPLTTPKDCGYAVASVLKKYDVQDINKQLIVVAEDPNMLPGSILIQEWNEHKGMAMHDGMAGLINVLRTVAFNKFKIGVGKPADPKMKLHEHVARAFTKEEQPEMDMFGYALDVTAQALQHYACIGDIKKTKKKFSNVKKLPRQLRRMEGLGFPFKVEEINKPEETKEEEKPAQETTA